MKKKLFFSIFFSLNIFILIFSLFLFIVSAKSNNTWPFNAGLGKYFPNFVKSYSNKIALPQEELKISSHYYSLKVDNFTIPSNDAVGLGGAINLLRNNNVLITLDDGEIMTFNYKNFKFSKKNKSIKNKYESIRDTYVSKELNKYLILAVINNSDNCRKIILDGYDYEYKENFFNIDNLSTLWISEEMCEESWTGNSGGRILVDGNMIYVSIGSLISGNSGINKYSQNINSSFGKIIKIDDNFRSSIYSLGHKNPQGLFFSKNKEFLFSTEHGPKGGDELNLIKKSQNYGWPCETKGVQYSYPLDNNYDKIWPSNLSKFGCIKNQTFMEPLYTWTPSIAISQGLSYKGDYFKMYKNNLIIGSLLAQSLFIINFTEDNKVNNIEKIEINFRVRDILETGDGRILVYNDSGGLNLISKSKIDSN